MYFNKSLIHLYVILTTKNYPLIKNYQNESYLIAAMLYRCFTKGKLHC